jgi:hypothetical protein
MRRASVCHAWGEESIYARWVVTRRERSRRRRRQLRSAGGVRPQDEAQDVVRFEQVDARFCHVETGAALARLHRHWDT